MTPPTRILLLGVDAPNPELIRRWAGAGVLPTFRRLLADGLVGDTRSVEGFFVGSTWPSFYTGVNPARHGVHSLVQLRPGTYDLERHDLGRTLGREPFWTHLSRAGRRVAVLDVPLSALSPGLEGLQMVEWGSHDAAYGFRAQPDGLEQETRARFGRHPAPASCDADRRSARAFVDLRRRLVEGVRRKAALTRHYLARGGFDLFVQVFTESHCVGHQCWHLHDPAHPAFDPATTARTGDPLREVYAAIDAAVGSILEQAGGDTLTIVLAAHGMTHRYGAQFLLPDLLVRLGVAALPGAAAPAGPEGPLSLVRSWMRARAPAGLVRSLRPVVQRWRARVPAPPAAPRLSLDPGRSRCFLVDNGLAVGGIRLNLAGREPAGLVAPGAEALALAGDVARALEAVVDLRTGRPAVRRVASTADLYRGPQLAALPDLLVEWSGEPPLGSLTVGSGAGAEVRLRSDRAGLLTGLNDYGRSGDHRPEGLFVAIGGGLRPARLPDPVSIMDFAPTLCRLLGAPLPDPDGRAIEALAGARVPAPV